MLCVEGEVMTIKRLHREDLCGAGILLCLHCGSGSKKYIGDKMTELQEHFIPMSVSWFYCTIVMYNVTNSGYKVKDRYMEPFY